MKPLNGLFKPIPFLIRYPIYHQKYYPACNSTLQLRPFSIMEDISLIYTWINKPRLLCSGHIKNYQRNMLKYYKGILDSGDSQALMVIKDGLPVCQVSLFQVSSDIRNPGPAKNAHDISLRYLADFRTSPSLFQSCIHLCLDYLFSFTENPTAFIHMLASGLITGEDFTRIGCKFAETYHIGNDPVKVFSCTGDELKND